MASDIGEIEPCLIELHLTKIEWLEQDVVYEDKIGCELLEQLGCAIANIDRVAIFSDPGNTDVL